MKRSDIRKSPKLLDMVNELMIVKELTYRRAESLLLEMLNRKDI